MTIAALSFILSKPTRICSWRLEAIYVPDKDLILSLETRDLQKDTEREREEGERDTTQQERLDTVIISVRRRGGERIEII